MSNLLIFFSILVSVGIISAGVFLIFRFLSKRKDKLELVRSFFTEEGEEIHIGI
jgi:uncharacterized BrkB/YihY/UPF0761 family membrane protein